MGCHFFVSGKPHLNESHGRPVDVTLAMLLMAEIRRSPVERKVVYPIMFKAWKMYIQTVGKLGRMTLKHPTVSKTKKSHPNQSASERMKMSTSRISRCKSQIPRCQAPPNGFAGKWSTQQCPAGRGYVSSQEGTNNVTTMELYVGVSTNRGTPKWMVYKGKPY